LKARLKIYCLLIIPLFFLGIIEPLANKPNVYTKFEKSIEIKDFRFEIITNDTGAVRQLTIKIFKNDAFLMNIKQKVDGFVTDAEAADLDSNGSPELYIFSSTYGSGSFGKIIGYQFYTNVFNVIITETTPQHLKVGYMGHDSYKIQGGYLLRTFPVYKAGEANAEPTGGNRTLVYRLLTTPEKKLVLRVIPRQ
jgi:hypothetical protein